MDPYQLPVYQQREKILSALADHQVIVVESPTGSGKTTQIPLILHEAGYSSRGIVGVTQPRRIAALSVSDFIAHQIGKKVPDTVGYTMRFEDKTDDTTVIKIMTDGILLQELKGDRTLSRYSVLMVDEAHERSLNIDFILGMLKSILAARPEFRVIVSSATINVEVFSEYFDGCPVVSIDAPMYPVEIIHSPPEIEGDQESLLAAIRDIVGRVMKKGVKGDVLIFLQGELAIKDCVQLLAEMDTRDELALIPLYARLAREDQAKVFLEYPGKRKVIVATNIAETSVTIDGVVHVIDSGMAKMNFYSPKTFTESLIEVPVSKASCNQRRGRAGRTAPGVCYRLYTRKDYESRPMYTTEEIMRTDLSEVVLRMAELGIRDFEAFDFLTTPGQDGIRAAVETLRLLDALGEERELTETGRMMCLFPILPKHARMIVEAIRSYPSVIVEVIIAATFLSVNSPFLLPAGEELEARRAHHTFRDPLGDFVSYQRIFEAFVQSGNKARFCDSHYLDLRTMNEIANIKGQLEEIVSGLGVPIGSGGPWDDYLCAISRGLIQFVCERTGQGDLSKPHGGQDPDPSGLAHVPREPALYRCGRGRAHLAHVRALGFAAAKADAVGNISPPDAGLREGRPPHAGERDREEAGFHESDQDRRGDFPDQGHQGRPEAGDHGMGEAAQRAPAARSREPPAVQEHLGQHHLGRQGDLLRDEALGDPDTRPLPSHGGRGVGGLAVRKDLHVLPGRPRAVRVPSPPPLPLPDQEHVQAPGVSHALHRLEGQLLVQGGEEPSHRAPGDPGEPRADCRRAGRPSPARRP